MGLKMDDHNTFSLNCYNKNDQGAVEAGADFFGVALLAIARPKLLVKCFRGSATTAVVDVCWAENWRERERDVAAEVSAGNETPLRNR